MKFNLIILLSLIALVSCKLEVKEIAEKLDKVLKYLEGDKVKSNEDVAELMVWGASELEMLPANTKNPPAGRLELAKSLEKRFLSIFNKFSSTIKSPLEKQFMASSPFWGHASEYKHQPGRVSGKEPLSLTWQQIVTQSASADEYENCSVTALEDNKLSPTNRQCKLACNDKAYEVANLDNGFALEDRISYIMHETLLNCTNHNEPARTKAVTAYCDYIMRQVNVLDKQKNSPGFDDSYLIYWNKVLTCGGYGFPEFFAEDRVKDIISFIKPDGSVEYKNIKPEYVDMSTGIMAVTLASVLRMLTETGN